MGIDMIDDIAFSMIMIYKIWLVVIYIFNRQFMNNHESTIYPSNKKYLPMIYKYT